MATDSTASSDSSGVTDALVVPIALQPANIRLSSNTKQTDKLLSTSASTFWETSGSSYPHWIEILVPAGYEASKLQVYVKDHSSASPKRIKVSGVAEHLVAINDIRGLSSTQVVTGCDASCSRSHGSGDICLVCGQTYGSGHSGHSCSSFGHSGKRGSFSSTEDSFSANIPKATVGSSSLTEIKRMELTRHTEGWVDLFTVGEVVSLSPGIIRIEVLDNHGGSNTKVTSVRLFGFQAAVAIGPWTCVVCQTENVPENGKCEVSCHPLYLSCVCTLCSPCTRSAKIFVWDYL